MNKLQKQLTLGAVVLIGLLGLFTQIGFLMGYKNGQLDYAQDKIRYTITNGLIIEIHGKVTDVNK